MDTQGLLLALILGRNIADPEAKAQIILLTMLLGYSPISLIFLILLARRAQSTSVSNIQLPEVINQPLLDSAQQILNNGLRVQIQELSEGAEKQHVIIQSPGAKSLVRQDSTVTLFVNKPGNQLELIKVPNVIDLPFEQAREELQDNNFRIERINIQDSSKRDEIVMDQEPKPGQNVPLGSLVKLTVSTYQICVESNEFGEPSLQS
ncbi:MAG: PASTA domain-containing protein [Calothrix sp. C42_A2020_038]|nr:PASTA domain-containing protein [Calothrix sp. C42_A2020_038]